MAGLRTRLLESPVPPGRGHGDPALPLRIISAAVLAPVALVIAVRGEWALAGFVAFFAVAMSYEWLKMSDHDAPAKAYSIFAALVSGSSALAGAQAWSWAMAVIVAGAALMAWERRLRGSIWGAAVGVIYIAAPCAAMIWIRNGETGGFAALIYLFAVVWAADTAAYLVGTWLGGPKLFPRASPNKTWSGLIAGTLAGAVSGCGAAIALGAQEHHLAFLGLGAGLALSAVAGDLLESIFKRRFGVKDTGTLIPGHGGVLDRVDALMVAVLVFAAALLIWPRLFVNFSIGAL